MKVLKEMLPLNTKLGRAWGWAVIDPGMSSDFQWVCWMRETGECWTIRNSQVLMEPNDTLGIKNATK